MGILHRSNMTGGARREILCNQAGVFNAQCGNEITSERIAELSARVDQLSGSGA